MVATSSKLVLVFCISAKRVEISMVLRCKADERSTKSNSDTSTVFDNGNPFLLVLTRQCT